MPPSTPPIPALPSLDTPPSWHNRAGRVDRSCCFVLTASPLWRQVPVDAWHEKKPPAAQWTPAPHADAERVRERSVWYTTPDTPASNSRGRRPDRVAPITLTAQDLWHFHRFETPAPLRGDFRTIKANAFKPAADATRWWNEVSAREADASRPSSSAAASHAAESPANQANPGRGLAAADGTPACDAAADHNPTRRTTPSPLDPPAVNPNRGAGFAMHLKMLGLPAHWQTTLTLERYVQHAKLKQHFLVCPVCETQNSGTGILPVSDHHHRQDACATKKKLPGGRVTKLFLPLCTPREWEDAQLAHLWLQTNTNPNRPYSEDAQRLLKRYAELFPGRNLRCRTCLGLRYGEVKGLK